MAISLDDLSQPGMVARPAYQAACDELARSLLTRGCALLQWQHVPAALQAAQSDLQHYWALPPARRAALCPLQAREWQGHRALTDDREVLEFGLGPWLLEDKPLPALEAATAELDGAARAVLRAPLRSQLVRLPSHTLAPALDDLPLPSHAWAASSLRCFSFGPASSGCEPHKHLLTLVWAPSQLGLQVQDGRGAWAGVPLAGRQLLVLPGRTLEYAHPGVCTPWSMHTLEYAACGLIKASSHRVVLPPGVRRRCLVYKLAAHPDATIHVLPALQAAGHGLGAAADRYPQPVTARQVVARFDATHRSANQTRPAAAAAVPARAAAVRVPARAAAMGRPAAAPAAAAAAANGAAAVVGGPGAAAAAAAAAAAPATPPAAASAVGPRPAAEQRGGKRARQQAPPAAQQPAAAAEADKIVITVRNQEGATLAFRILWQDPLSSLMDAACQTWGLDLTAVRFVNRGERVDSSYTAADLELDTADILDCFPEQLGD